MSASPRIFVIAGPPNCGKSTLFNALTGLRQTIGNYPGVTVEKKTGICLDQHGCSLTLLDSPGVYSLSPKSPDEEVTRGIFAGTTAGVGQLSGVIVVLDSSNLLRQLALAMQIIELGLPTMVCLNMLDIAEQRGLHIDAEQLSKLLGGVAVVKTQANTRRGVAEIRQFMARKEHPTPGKCWQGEQTLESALGKLYAIMQSGVDVQRKGQILLWLAHNAGKTPKSIEAGAANLQNALQQFNSRNELQLQEELSRQRFLAARQFCAQVLKQSSSIGHGLSDRIDNLVLHRIWGWVIFIGCMLLLFYSIFSIAEYPMGWIEGGFGALQEYLGAKLPQGALKDLLLNGMLGGLSGVLVFLPQIILLFFALGLLESSGYMARAAVLMDRVMRAAGLPGKAFIPLLSSYACAIPGIMATRTIDNAKDRLITMLIAPWMSCSARLPVYSLLLGVLFFGKSNAAWYQACSMLGLYALGTGMALLFSRLLRRTVSKEPPAPMLLELPQYRCPDFKFIALNLWQRASSFVKRAGTVILALSIVLWGLSEYPKSEDESKQAEQTWLARIGHTIQPAFAPLGFDWRISTGVLASFAAREVFGSHMVVLLANTAQPSASEGSAEGGADAGGEQADEETRELQANIELCRQARRSDGSVLFDVPTCGAILVFFVFAMQCLPTSVVVRRESASWRWALGQFVVMSLFAWLMAWLCQFILKLWF